MTFYFLKLKSVCSVGTDIFSLYLDVDVLILEPLQVPNNVGNVTIASLAVDVPRPTFLDLQFASQLFAIVFKELQVVSQIFFALILKLIELTRI